MIVAMNEVHKSTTTMSIFEFLSCIKDIFYFTVLNMNCKNIIDEIFIFC